MSQTKVKSGLLNFPDQTDFVKLPSGTTAQRPSSPEEGYSRYNTTDDKIEYWNGTVWQQLPGIDPPTLTSVDYPGNDLAADPAGGQTILINGTNFVSGISVEIGSTEVSSVTLNSPTQLAITSPALTAGDYDVTVTNLDAGTVTALDFISYNGVPSWQTAAGSLGSLNFGEAVSTITLSATEPDGGNVSYSVTSGALPTGLSLSSSGDITGTMPSGSAETNYSFTVTATDDENQSTDRSFTITGVVPFVNSQNFNTILFTGNGTSHPITGVGFQPDLVWIKRRDAGYPYTHKLIDSVRGATKRISSDETGGEITETSGLQSFNVDGFTLGGDGGYNFNGAAHVAWCWKAGGTPVSNENGTITSQVSANIEAGFSVVTFTGNGTTASVGHGLGQKPSIIFTKNRSASEDWFTQQYMYVPSGNAAYGYLNTTAAFVGFTDSLTDDAVMQQGGTNGQNYVSYCFAEVEGFSSFGSYVGNGSTSGPTVITGFEPAFIMFKGSSISSEWGIFDNKRDTANPNTAVLLAQSSQVEAQATGGGVNFLSNGFQLNDNNSNRNSSGETYIYMAFAANPNTQVPTKADSFNTVLYTGNGASQSITGVGFKPALTWVKSRSINYDHQLHDSVRGPGYGLLSNSTAGENFYNTITSFDSDGFTVDASSFIGTNASGQTFVSWNWKGAELPAINSNGSIPSVVSANPAAGFSIVSYTGTETISTIGHGLNGEPKMIIVKRRENANDNWYVYNSNLSGINNYLQLNTNAAELTFSPSVWGGSAPSSTVFSVGTDPSTNSLNEKMIAYCFAEVAGFSKFGSYTGTGASGNFQELGFEPAFILIKQTNINNNWWLWDNKRDTTNPNTQTLSADNTSQEYSGSPYTNLNILSTSFEPVGLGDPNNQSGGTYVYMAFANQF